MKRPNVIIGMAVFLLLFTMTSSSKASDSKFRLGLQGAQFAAGLSGIVEISDPWALQGVVDVGADAVALRLLNRFTQKRFWNAYGIGTVGLWQSDNYRTLDWWDDNDSVNNDGFGVGIGIGIEYDWRGLDGSLPPLGWNLELGASIVPGFYFNIGLGLHWMF